MKVYASSALLFTFLVSKCVCMDTSVVSDSSEDVEEPQTKSHQAISQTVHSKTIEILTQDENVIKRTSRDLRIPFRPQQRNVEHHSSARPTSNQRPSSPPRVFSHPKLRQGSSSSDLQAQQQQYRPAYALTQGPAQKPSQQSSRSYHRNNQQDSARRPQDMNRGPLRMPGRDMLISQPAQRSRFPSNSGRPRQSTRQNTGPSSAIDILHSSSSDNVYSPSGNVPNSESRPPVKDRVIDVYHHIPVSPKPSTNVFGGIIHTPNPTFQTQNPFFQQSPPPTFVSPQPSLGLQIPHQQPNIPQNFPGSEHPPINPYEPQLNGGSSINTNVQHIRPVVLPAKFPSEDPYPFVHQFVQSEPLRNVDEFQQPNAEVLDILPQFSPANKERFTTSSVKVSQDWNTDFDDSSEIIKDLIRDAEVDVIPINGEENPTNKTGKVKKYWDFRKQSFVIEPMQPNNPKTSPSITTNKEAVKEPSSVIPNLEKAAGGNIDPKVVNDEVRLVASHLLPKIENVDQNNPDILKEFYFIDNKPTMKFEDTAELPPQFLHVNHESSGQSSKNTQSVPNIRINKFLKATANPVLNSDATNSNNNSENTQIRPVTQSVPEPILNHQIEVKPKNEPLDGNKRLEDPVYLWNQNVKYIPADIFRKNTSTTPYNILKEKYSGGNNEEEVKEENSEHPSGSGLYARNKAQFQKFEDFSTPQYPLNENDENREEQPKQYFRGPQHFANNWTVLEDNPIPHFGHRQLISTSVSYLNSWLSNPTTAIPLFTRHTTKDSGSQKQVLNAWHLANKVFGRKNYTRKYSSTTTTMKPEPTRIKFTYSTVTRSTTEIPPEVSSKFGAKKFFNFRTGTTSNAPDYSETSSTQPVTPSIFGEYRIVNEQHDSHHSNTPLTNYRDKYTITPKTNAALERMYRRRNHSIIPSEDRKPYYINLKPVTRPYSSSSTTELPVTLPVQNQEPTEIYKKAIPLINIEHTVRKFGVNRTRTTSVRPLEIIPIDTNDDEVISTSRPATTHIITTEVIETSSESTPAITTSIEPSPETTTSASLEEYVTHTDLDAVETVTKVGTYHIPPRVSNTKSASVITIPPSSRSKTISTNPPRVSSTELATEVDVNQEQVVVDSLNSMKIKMQEMMSKGMRHLMPLVMEMSTDIGISSDCTFSLLRWLRGIRSLEPWAIRSKSILSPPPLVYFTV
ncbi:hypothetical protein JTE90_005042 [Oedothorax gibbosus]|uniref:Uncharacterized protein n=1 Tax=Oedothorax gibbosus TaxID=931172 RepID=A0AAV6VAW6_9ARAC|nr:hypothetical protein JTE90_005042 [Oedothorax gibbosus]